MNKITLIGNLTRDPEARATKSGVSVCSFTIAVNRRFSGQDGEKKTDFFRINTFRGLADNCRKYLEKGRKVAVVGELQARTYQGRDGTTQISLDVLADEVEFLEMSAKKEKGHAGIPAPMPLPDISDLPLIDEDDDVPFN